ADTPANYILVYEPGVLTVDESLSLSTTEGTINCYGGTTTVEITATGGTPPYSGAGVHTVTAGTQTFVVTDAKGCTSEVTLTITEPAQLIASSSATAIACYGGETTISVSANGGIAPYSGTGDFIVPSGNYTYTVTDANGCSTSTMITVTEPSSLVATASNIAPILCFGGTTQVEVNATGGTPPYNGTGSFSQFEGTMAYTVVDANGCTSEISVTLAQPTKVEVVTTTTPSSCSAIDGSATANPSGGSGSYSYLWSNGQTTQTATNLAGGNYSVTITDSQGCTASTTAIVNTTGGSIIVPGSISGPAGACRSTSGIVYSVAPVPGATSYIWTLPSGASGTSITNSITVAFDAGYSNGFICVAAVNVCGTSGTSCLNIPVNNVPPPVPAVISGTNTPCGPGIHTYSTSAPNATSFNWTVTGTGVSIVNGQGTNTIQVSIPSNFGQGSIQVRSVNCKGSSAVRGMTITGIPAHSNPVTGPVFVCAGGTGTYSMATVVGATSYTWSVTGDATVVSTVTTASTTTATINYGPAWTSGIVTITDANSCGSYSRSFAVNSTPAQPGSITGPGSGVCRLSDVTYSIAPVPTATSYNWTVPAGATIVSTAPNGLSIVVQFTPAFTSNSSTICVSATSACGTGPARCFTITSRPAAPVISGPASVCKTNSSVGYSLAPVSGATSYSWSVTGGASISPSGTNATLNYNTALNPTAVIRANANSLCGPSQPGQKSVSVNLFCRTAADDIEFLSTEMAVYPNPTSGKILVSFNSENETKYQIKISDLIGNIISNEVFTSESGMNTREFDITGVTKGVYMVTLSADDVDSRTTRIIVK
ncbi:MAG: T9SS type A sorting domain-containing protein, partial [Bacteroidota bacterium]